MMRLGFLSDAHGNPLGVSRCLRILAAEGAARFFFLGDAVGYMPAAGEVLHELRDVDAECQMGNHEAMLLARLAAPAGLEDVYLLDRTRRALSARDRTWLGTWQLRRELRVGSRRVLCVHGSPGNPLTEYVYPDASLDQFAGLGYDAVFTAHTHRPFVARCNGVLVVNVGSCGLPRDQGDLASCAIYDPVGNDCEILRVPMPGDEVLGQFPEEDMHRLVRETLRPHAESPFGRLVAGADR